MAATGQTEAPAGRFYGEQVALLCDAGLQPVAPLAPMACDDLNSTPGAVVYSSGDSFQCTPMACPTSPGVADAHLQDADRVFGQGTTVVCDRGYAPNTATDTHLSTTASELYATTCGVRGQVVGQEETHWATELSLIHI